MRAVALRLTLLDGSYAIARLDPQSPIPQWPAGDFVSITRTRDELSVVAAEPSVPRDVKAERGFRALKLEGPFAFTEIGILASITAPLAAARISLFAVSTYDTDYVLVKDIDLARATETLRESAMTIGA
jgi:uncharacterized protein